MPAESQAQRGFLAERFGPEWMHVHHFDNKGKLPQYVDRKKMEDGGMATDWSNIEKDLNSPDPQTAQKARAYLQKLLHDNPQRSFGLQGSDLTSPAAPTPYADGTAGDDAEQWWDGMVDSSPSVSMFGGGIVKQPKGIPALPKSQYGTDTIPAALTKDEMVLNGPQQKAVMPIPGKEHMLKPDQLAKFSTIHGPKSWIHAPRMKFDMGFAGMPAPQGGPTYPPGRMPPGQLPPGMQTPPQLGTPPQPERLPPTPRTPPTPMMDRPNPLSVWSPFGPPQAGTGSDMSGVPPWAMAREEKFADNHPWQASQYSPMDLFNHWQKNNPGMASLKNAGNRFTFQDGTAGTPSPSGTPFMPKSDAEFDRLPIGAMFTDPGDGKVYRKHSQRSRTEQHGDQAMFQYPFA